MKKVNKSITLWITVLFCMISLSVVWADEKGIVVEQKDGNYEIDVSMEGGTGKASITSPAIMIVKDKKAYVQIEWSSPNYDYMIVKGEKYLPINKEGNSVFEIPILVFDKPMEVIADTTAMSVPHEIEYTFTFDSESIAGKDDSSKERYQYLIGILFIVGVCIFAIFNKKRQKKLMSR